MNQKKYKNIIIVNSDNSIGKGLAWLFSEAGHRIMLHGKDEELPTLCRAISKKHRVQTSYTFADISNPQAIQNMLAHTEEKLGSVDGVVNLINMEYNAPVEEFPLEKWHLLLQNNLTNTFLLIKEVWKNMKKQKFGRIVNITSPYSLTATAYKIAYVTCCHGINGLTKALALEGAQFGITCNTIAPGKIRTPEVEEEISDYKLAHNISEKQIVQQIILKNQPNKDFVHMENIGIHALYLLSDYGSAINGTIVPIDGGWTV